MCTMLCWSLKRAMPGKHPPIVGRTFDLKSAYKQFGLRTEDRYLIRIATVDPSEGKPILCGLDALPFEGVGSVAGFLHVSLATWFVDVAGLKLCWTGYCDDFTTLSRSELQNHTAWAVDSLFGLLGLDYAREGAKAPEFSAIFEMRGVLVDTSRAQQGEVAVGHTAEGSSSWAKLGRDTFKQEVVYKDGGEVVRAYGLLRVFSSRSHNKLASQKLGKLCRSQRFVEDLTEDNCGTILALRNRVENAEPIVISPKLFGTWFVFTDGACETSEDGGKFGGVGGVLVSANWTYLQHLECGYQKTGCRSYVSTRHVPSMNLKCCPTSSPFKFGPTF